MRGAAKRAACLARRAAVGVVNGGMAVRGGAGDVPSRPPPTRPASLCSRGFAAGGDAPPPPSLPPTLRLVRADGTHAILSAAAATREAAAARLDLVPVNAAASPPVFRLACADGAATAARARAASARAAALAARRAAAVKELRVGALASQHDVDTRLARARELVGKGWKVRMVVPLPRGRGRARGGREAAAARLGEVAAAAAAFADVEAGAPRPGGKGGGDGPFVTLSSREGVSRG